MACSIKLLEPVPGGSVVAGQPGRVRAEVCSGGPLHWVVSVRFRVEEAGGSEVQRGQADVSGGEAVLDLSWPSRPGPYVVHAEADGYVTGSLALTRVPFRVQPAAPAEPVPPL